MGTGTVRWDSLVVQPVRISRALVFLILIVQASQVQVPGTSLCTF